MKINEFISVTVYTYCNCGADVTKPIRKYSIPATSIPIAPTLAFKHKK